MEGDRVEPPAFLSLADHPVRWRLLTALAVGDRRVRELVEELGQPQNLVSYHLRLLRDGGLVTARRSSHDARDTYYHLDLERCSDALRETGAALHPQLEMPQPAPAPPITTTARVLFVCTGNSARSPIAEALLRHHSKSSVAVASAGVLPKDRMHPGAIRVLRDRFDIDIRDQTPRSISDVTDSAADHGVTFDRLITLCDKARESLPPGAHRQRAHWSIPDPTQVRGPLADSAFLSVVDDIDTRVRHLLPTLGTTTTDDRR